MGDETWIVRAPDKQLNPAEDVNANNPNLFTLEFHHGGELTTFPKVCYQRGGITYVDKVKTCHFSMKILNDIMLSLGYDLDDLDYLRYHFRVPGEDMDFGLRPLGTDFDVNRLIKHAIVTKVIEVYVERVQKYPSFVPCSDLGEFVQDHNAAVVYNADDEGSYEGSYDGSYEGSDEEDVDKIDQDSIVGIIEGDDDGNDPDFIVDEENLVEDYEVDMDEFRAVVDYDAENLVEDNVIEENLGDVQVDLDDFDSLSDPDDDTKLQKAVRSIRRTKNKVKETSDCPFYVGQSFRDREAIKETVKKHAVESRRQLIVRLDLRTCSCRKWDLTGLPCKHAVACIWNLALHGKDDGVIEKWVDKCYWLETWKEVYSHTIDPVNGQDLWTPSACPTKLTAPKHHKQVGRPKKKRKKSAVEVSELSEKMAANGKMSRKGDTVTCDKCGHRGHNRRTCKGQPPQDGVGHE